MRQRHVFEGGAAHSHFFSRPCSSSGRGVLLRTACLHMRIYYTCLQSIAWSVERHAAPGGGRKNREWKKSFALSEHCSLPTSYPRVTRETVRVVQRGTFNVTRIRSVHPIGGPQRAWETMYSWAEIVVVHSPVRLGCCLQNRQIFLPLPIPISDFYAPRMYAPFSSLRP